MSADRFGPVLTDWLERAGAAVHLTRDITLDDTRKALARADVLLLADYAARSPVVAPGGPIPPNDLAAMAPGIAVVQFAGGVDETALTATGISVYPRPPVGPLRMARTLAHIGPRPVIELHAAGLKVGEISTRARLAGLSLEETETYAIQSSDLCQRVTQPGIVGL